MCAKPLGCSLPMRLAGNVPEEEGGICRSILIHMSSFVNKVDAAGRQAQRRKYFLAVKPYSSRSIILIICLSGA